MLLFSLQNKQIRRCTFLYIRTEQERGYAL